MPAQILEAKQKKAPNQESSHLPVRSSSGPLCFSGLLWEELSSRAPGIFLFSCEHGIQLKTGIFEVYYQPPACFAPGLGVAVPNWEFQVYQNLGRCAAHAPCSTHLGGDVFGGLDSDGWVPLPRRQHRDLIQELVDAGHEVSPVLGFVGNVVENLPRGDLQVVRAQPSPGVLTRAAPLWLRQDHLPQITCWKWQPEIFPQREKSGHCGACNHLLHEVTVPHGLEEEKFYHAGNATAGMVPALDVGRMRCRMNPGWDFSPAPRGHSGGFGSKGRSSSGPGDATTGDNALGTP